MKNLVKVINIISTIFVGLGLALACSIEITNHSFITFLQIYAPIFILIGLGGLGLNIAHDPNRFFSEIYALFHAIVNTITNEYYYDFPIIERFNNFYAEGFAIYDSYYYI